MGCDRLQLDGRPAYLDVSSGDENVEVHAGSRQPGGTG
ncbi:hypothetical protein THTE_1483 [Thermogutta terrifontis]|uniref:Uncharacterized protein n=1 Tax=Thermogutta terrifontis TaxID=1331910 RepID=A0A286RDQ3_9BACT|nr:hypothetical protein THTE_1483 [Thermogutta terrifontis]